MSSPALGSDGTIYTGSNDEYIYSLNPDGTLKWKFKTGGDVESSPVIGPDGTVYVGSDGGGVYALNPDGTLKWKYDTGNDVQCPPALGDDGTVYVGSRNRNVYALNSDGTVKWTYATGDWVWAAPAIGADGTVYAASMDNNLYALNPDGTVKWTFSDSTAAYYSSPALGADGTVYIGSWDENVYAVTPSGKKKWEFKTGWWVSASPVVGTDGTVYIGSMDQYFYALNPDGSKKWSYKTDGTVVSSAAIGTDGTIYVGSGDWKLYAFNPDGSVKWEYETSAGVDSSPAIGADGTVYVGSSDTNFYAIEGDSRGLTWPMLQQNTRRTGRREDTEFGAGPTQASGTSVTVQKFIGTLKTAETLKAAYSGLAGYTPVGKSYDFNATVAPSESNATFFFETDYLDGTPAEYWLYKLKNGRVIPFHKFSKSLNDHNDGSWWITDKDTTFAMNASSILTLGVTYRVYFAVKDNGIFDINATKGAIQDPVTLGRFPVSNSPSKSKSVLSCVCNGIQKKADTDDLIVEFGHGAVRGFTPTSGVVEFNASVSPVYSETVFRWNSTQLAGTVGNLTLRKFFADNFTSVDFGKYVENSSAEAEEGDWWITYRNTTRLNKDDRLDPNTNYFINFAIKDNGRYDADPEPGRIKDPMSLGTIAETGSSSGCMLDPSAGFGMEWMLVLLGAGIAALRFRRN